MGERMLSYSSPGAGSDALERTAPVLRQRIYGAVTCLSTLLILVRDGGSDFAPSAAAIDLAVGGAALWGASLFASYVSDVAAHGHPSRSEMAHGLRDSVQILEAFALPILLLVLASLGLMPFGAALWAGIWITVVSLGLFALLAARRLPVLAWQRWRSSWCCCAGRARRGPQDAGALNRGHDRRVVGFRARRPAGVVWGCGACGGSPGQRGR